MNLITNPKPLMLALFISLLAGISISAGQKKVASGLPEFLILIESSGNNFTLTAHKGCTWDVLNFTLTQDGTPQAIDEKGLVSLPGNQFAPNTTSTFLFTIQRTATGVKLKGKNGTAWTDLSFSCTGGNCHQAINEEGMTTI